MVLAFAQEPFVFSSRLHQRELTGISARTFEELLHHLKIVDGSSIYHHTHHFLEQHQYTAPLYPNDFAYWAAEIMGESRLGERLSSVRTTETPDIHKLREQLVAILEAELRERPSLKSKEAEQGQEFHFIKSLSFIFKTPLMATDLKTFAECLRRVTITSIYFHFFESRLSLEQMGNDFSRWLSEQLGEKKLAGDIARLDPFVRSLEGLRTKLVELVEVRANLEEGKK